MNPPSILLRVASLLVLVCVVSAVPQGYGSGGDGGLGVDLGGAGGHGGSGVGGGSVLPFVFVGKGVLPESAIGGGASGGAAGGVVGEEYSVPSADVVGVDADVAGSLDGGVSGGAANAAIGEEYTAPAVVPEVSPVSPPGSEYAAPH
ncbi:uncharacterized protein LOC134770188 [Penaeus indicus]|uniref:uncharacterized protein LOC134770188 n=1 Tax=Penaeus indicus TaxID=29960 RepID=UPI00300C7E62